jgi:16S rRNA (cytidine1402-2'-O)-methyltransferase
MEKQRKKGTLFVVSTPLGNLRDITLRALDTLREVHLIAAEDTRVTRRLLSAYRIPARLISYREKNRQTAADKIVGTLTAGHDVALVTDAGTPAISDPGGHLVARCVDDGIDVVPIPGPSSIVCALSVCGLDSSEFVFLGFLPRKGTKRGALLSGLADEPRTTVMFESPQRVRKTLSDILGYAGDRRAVLCRELTKVHEEVIRGRISTITAEIERRDDIRGEVVIVVAGKEEQSDTRVDGEVLAREAARALSENPGRKPKEVARIVSDRLAVPMREAYEAVVGIKEK